ncbi:MAG: ABC transporter substrate-binding protein [Bacillota bacterium]
MITVRGKVVLLLLLALFITSVAAACGPAEPAEPAEPTEAEYEDTIVLALERDTDTFDNIKTSFGAGGFHDLYEPLLSQNWDREIVGRLATDYEISDDGLQITLHLRDDVTFHDGTKMTADLLADYYRLLTDPDLSSPTRMDFIWSQNPEAADEHTLVFHLDEPRPYAITQLTQGGAFGAPMQPEVWREHGPWEDKTYGTEMAVGTGPYMFEEWIPGDRQVFVRYDDYDWAPDWFAHEGPALTERVVYRIIPDAATRLAELEAGNVHIVVSVPTEHVDRVRQMDDVELLEKPSWGWGDLMYNTSVEPLNDVRVRQALALAIDQEYLVDTVFFGLAEPSYGFYNMRFGDEQVVDEEAFGYDPERAQELLAEAGHADGFTVTLAVELIDEYIRVCEVIQDHLSDVGIEVEIKRMDKAAWNDHVASDDFQMCLKGASWHSLDYMPFFYGSWQIPYPGYPRWDDPTTDDLFQRAESARTMEERTEIYREAQQYLIEEAILLPLWEEYDYIAVREEVEGFKWHPWYDCRLMHGVAVRKTD